MGPAGGGLPRPALAIRESPYGDVGGWWDAGGQFGAGEFAVRLERGTSPSPRVVFDRATFRPSCPGLRPSPE